jgi:hypothetical protein
VTRSTQTLAPEDGQPRADACGAKGEAPSLKPWNRAAGIRDPVTVMVLPWLLTPLLAAWPALPLWAPPP